MKPTAAKDFLAASAGARPARVDTTRSWRASLAVAVLAAATLAAHGWSLGDGLFLDDHWHQQRLRDGGWSPTELLEATTIQPDRFIHTWWQERSVRWQYARPFSFLFMKVVYWLSSGNVVVQHAASLVLHLAAAGMVYTLCRLLTRHRFWSLVGGLLFVVYSHGVFAVAWLAAQNIVLQTVLMLAALLLYIRASGLLIGPEPVAADLFAPQAPRQYAHRAEPAVGAGLDVPPLRVAPFAGALILWFMALFSRENAVMLPAILAAFDLAFGGRRHVWARRRAYLLLMAVAAAFLAWRLLVYHHPMPDVYVRRPDGDGYVLWCVAKLMHYLCSAVWLSPMTVGPTGRFNPFKEVPGDCLLMFVILAVLGAGYYRACRRVRGFWIWPMWLILAVLPVVPVLATPHSGYLCGVAFSIAMVLGPSAGKHLAGARRRRWSPAVAIWFLIATTMYIPIYRALWGSMVAAERYTIAGITAEPPPNNVTDIFFINLPFVNIYANLCLQEAWGPAAANIRCHVLTYAPSLLRMDQPCRVDPLDDRRLAVSVAGRPYFSGLLGRFLIDGLRDTGRLHKGQRVSGDGFDVEVPEASSDGVPRLVFTFREPLSSDRYRFYVTTPACPAAVLTFGHPQAVDRPNGTLANHSLSLHDVRDAARRLASGKADAAEVLFDGMGRQASDVRRESLKAFQRVARPVAAALGAPVQDSVVRADPSAAEVRRIGEWWRRTVDDRVLETLWTRRDDAVALRRARDRLSSIRAIASRIIRTDMYFTGPPFPGPRSEARETGVLVARRERTD